MMQDGTFRPASVTRGNQPYGQPGQGEAQRHYASETDVPSRSAPVHDHPRLPRTPQKSASSSPAPVGYTNWKARNRNRTRPESISFSPNSANLDRATPPYASGPKSSTATAFAGATFHASPAPSALPLPKFNTKQSDPLGAEDKAVAAPFQEPSPPATDIDMPTPHGHSPELPARESPLEFMFRADRQEKERARQIKVASPPHPSRTVSASPYLSPHSPAAQPMPSSLPTQPHRRLQDIPRHDSPNSTSKLDGYMRHLSQPIGPAFSTPYHERIRAARGSPNQTPDDTKNRHDSLPPGAQSQSDALKKLLFGSPATASQPSPPIAHAAGGVAAIQADSDGADSSVDTRGPSENGERDARILAMEDGLRKMLKMSS